MNTVNYDIKNQWVGTMECPSCRNKVLAWRSSGMSDCWPHFYCDKCSNAYHNIEDQVTVWNEKSERVLKKIALSLPACPCGGHFVPGANPKCPTCGTEFTHQDDPVKRLSDPHVIILHGACFFGNAEPYRVNIGCDQKPS